MRSYLAVEREVPLWVIVISRFNGTNAINGDSHRRFINSRSTADATEIDGAIGAPSLLVDCAVVGRPDDHAERDTGLCGIAQQLFGTDAGAVIAARDDGV